jgi:hypothetical protein
MSNLTTDYRKLKILYKLCFRIHEKYIYRLENIPSKRDYIEKLKFVFLITLTNIFYMGCKVINLFSGQIFKKYL